jgi:hypothetical protein
VLMEDTYVSSKCADRLLSYRLFTPVRPI